MNELFLGALDLSHYYRDLEWSNNGYFNLSMRDVPEQIRKDLQLIADCRAKVYFYFNGGYFGKNPVTLWRLRILSLKHADIGKAMFDRSLYPELPTLMIEGSFADGIPF